MKFGFTASVGLHREIFACFSILKKGVLAKYLGYFRVWLMD
jgi:hypothetical protein